MTKVTLLVHPFFSLSKNERRDISASGRKILNRYRRGIDAVKDGRVIVYSASYKSQEISPIERELHAWVREKIQVDNILIVEAALGWKVEEEMAGEFLKKRMPAA